MCNVCDFCSLGRVVDKELAERHRLEKEASDLMAEVAGVLIQRYDFMAGMGGPRPFDGLIEVLQREVIRQMDWEPSKYAAKHMDLHPRSIIRQRPRERSPRQRMSHGKVMRVFARDGFRCIICGSNQDLTVDHIWPLIKGGTYEEENLASMCSRHNSKKSDMSLEDFLARTPLREKQHYMSEHAAVEKYTGRAVLVVWAPENHHRREVNVSVKE